MEFRPLIRINKNDISIKKTISQKRTGVSAILQSVGIFQKCCLAARSTFDSNLI